MSEEFIQAYEKRMVAAHKAAESKTRNTIFTRVALSLVGFLFLQMIFNLLQNNLLYRYGPTFFYELSILLMAGIAFAAAVTIAELPKPSLEKIIRGGIAGLAGFLPALIIRMVMQESSMVLSIISVTLAALLRTLAIDYPKFKWLRFLLFAWGDWLLVVSFAGYYQSPNMYSFVAFIPWITIALGYCLIPRDSTVKKD